MTNIGEHIKVGLEKFEEFVLHPNSAADQRLGDLAALIGKWRGVGKGINIIAVPRKGANGDASFAVITHRLSEEIVFTPIPPEDKVPNRGDGKTQFVTGLTYKITVTDADTGGVLHLENGMILNYSKVKLTDNPSDENTAPDDPTAPKDFIYTRQGSIPHGNVINAYKGSSVVINGNFKFDEVNFKPKGVGFGYLEGGNPGYFDKKVVFFDSIVQTLQDEIDCKKLGKVTIITLNTDQVVPPPPLTNPTGKGQEEGVINIPFEQQEANPLNLNSKFWVEEILNERGDVIEHQLQYTQEIDLAFLGIRWPHVQVNTLQRVLI